ncbi:hypothetical protein [Salinibacterium sp.]|nr:hypothetical protein [Salinibacterium sp.]
MVPFDIDVTVESVPDMLSTILDAAVVLLATIIGLGGLLLVNRHDRQQKR